MVGVLAVQIKLDDIYQQLNFFNRENLKIHQYLVGADNKLRSSYDESGQDVLIASSEIALINELIDNPRMNSAIDPEYLAQDGQYKAGHVARLRISGVDWFLVSEVDRAGVMESVQELFTLSLVVLILVTAIVAYLAQVKAKSFVGPIHKLLAYTRSATKRGYAKELKLDGNSELNELAHAFQEMLKAQQKHEQLLEESRAEALWNYNETLKQKYALDQHSIVTVTNRAGVIEYVNDKFVEISGYSVDELVGKTHKLLNSGFHDNKFFQDMYTTILSGETWKAEIKKPR